MTDDPNQVALPDVPEELPVVEALNPSLTAASIPVDGRGPETTNLELVGLEARASAIDQNYWWMRDRRINESYDATIGDLAEAVYGRRDGWMPEEDQNPPEFDFHDPSRSAVNDQWREERTQTLQAGRDAMFKRLAELREVSPGEFANFPSSDAEARDWARDAVRRELQEEEADIRGKIDNRSVKTTMGGLAGFAGAAATGITDIEGVTLLPLGFGSGSLARQVALESLLGAGGAAMTVPAQQSTAEFLGRKAPDPLTTVMMGYGFGAALPVAGRGLTISGNALTEAGRVRNADLLGLTARADASDLERGAGAVLAREEATRETAPEGIVPEEHAANVDAAEKALLSDRPQDLTPDAVLPEPSKVSGVDIVDDGSGVVFKYEAGGNADPASNQVGYVYGKLLDLGVEPHIAAGLMGNFMQESGRGLNTGAIGDNGNAIGMGQWNGPRRRALQRYAAERGQNWRNIDLQIEFFWKELHGSERTAWSLIRQAKTADEAARIASQRFWRPGLPHLSSRMAYARMVFDQYQNGQVPKGGSPGSWLRPGDDVNAGGIQSFNPNDLNTDPSTYQYKLGADKSGETGRLSSETDWDPSAGFGVSVHERLDGSRYIADGHQRHALASRLADKGGDQITMQGFVYREADGWTVDAVRAQSALSNIAQDSGLPASVGLSPAAIDAVTSGRLTDDQAAVIGRVLPGDDALQAQALATFAKAKPKNAIQAESIANDLRAGGADYTPRQMAARANVVERASKAIRKDEVFLNSYGGGLRNGIDRTAAESLAQGRIFETAARQGPVRAAIDKAVAAGGRDIDGVVDAIRRAGPEDPPGSAAAKSGEGSIAEQTLGAPGTRPSISDLPPEGNARPQPHQFDDPLEDRTAVEQVAVLERDIRERMTASPNDFEFEISMGEGEGAPSMRVSDAIAELDDEADFLDQLQFCMPKGGT